MQTHARKPAPAHIDEQTLLSIAAWLRLMAPLFTPKPQQKMLTVAGFVETYNERARAHDPVPTSKPPQKKSSTS